MSLFHLIIQVLTTIALAWALGKICLLVRHVDRMVQMREHPEYMERKSLWRVLNEVL